MRKDNLIRMLIFGVVFILFGCSEDLYDEPIPRIPKKFKIVKTTFNNIKDAKMKSLVMKSQKALMEQRAFKNINKSLEDYIIDTANVIEISDGMITSYTFPIISTDSTKFENLVSIKYNDEEYKSYIVEYDLSSQEIEELSSDNSTIETKPDYITDLETNSRMSPAGPCVIVSHESVLACTNANGNTIIIEGDLGDGCVGLPFDLTFDIMTINTSCNSLSFGSGGSSDTGTTTGLPSGNGGGGGTIYSSNTSSDPNVLTTPNNPQHGIGGGSTPQSFPDTPCGRMQKKSSETAFKQKFKDLNKDLNFNKKFETGYYEKADGSLNFMTGTIEKPTLKFPQTTTSFMHIHMNDTQKEDDDGNITINCSVKILSPADISALIGAAGNALQNNLSPYESYAIMLSDEGIFSVNLTDTNVAMSPIMKAEMDFSYAKKASKIFKETSANSIERKEALQKMLLELLKEKGLGDKVALYEGVVDLATNLPTINWVKKSLDANGNLVETPC